MEMITVWLTVGLIVAYLLAGIILYRHTFKETVPNQFDRALLVIAPILFVLRRVSEGHSNRSREEPPDHPRN